MTQRENFIHYLKGETYERIPTSEDILEFEPSVITDNVARGKVLQQEPFTGELGGRDMFGVDWVYCADVGGSMEKAPLLTELSEWRERVQFPDYTKYDWEQIACQNRDYLNTEKLKMSILYSGFFERLISFVGFENALIALIDEDTEDDVRELFDRLAEVYIQEIKMLHDYCGIEFFVFHDDWGSQRGPLFSMDIFEKLILPYIRKVVRVVHEEGVFVEMHSCGLIESFIPGLITTEVDTWRGQKVNDKLSLVDKYGSGFKFCVEIRPDEDAVEDDTVEKMISQFKENYQGKNVWASIGRNLSQHQKELVCQELCLFK